MAALRQPQRAIGKQLVLVVTAGLLAAVVLASTPVAAGARPVAPPGGALPGATSQPKLDWLDRISGCTYFVAQPSDGGRDSNQGTTADQPWESIAKAMRALKQGETGCVRQGTYSASNLTPAASGTDARPIALKAQGAVTITAPDDATTFDLSSAQQLGYWLIDGFTVDKQGHDGAAVTILGAPQGKVEAVAVRNNVLRDGRAPFAVQIRGQAKDILVENNEITGFKRWEQGTTSRFEWEPNFGRADANAISIEANVSAGVPRDEPSVERVLIRGNSLHDNGGDGVQCQGGETVDAQTPLALDPADIDIIDNRVVNVAGSPAVEENAYDIKSCQRVSIRGSDAPSPGSPGAQFNKIGEFLPTVADRDLGPNNSDGAAIVLHYQARSVLIENLRLWDVCTGIAIGRPDTTARDIVVRRTLMFGLRYQEGPPDGTDADAARCRSRGVVVTNAVGMKVYHNTVDGFVDRGIMVEPDGGSPSTDIDLFNNILSARPDPTAGSPRRPIFISFGVAPDQLADPTRIPIGSDNNLFWLATGGPDQPHFALNGRGMPFVSDTAPPQSWQGASFDVKSGFADPKFPPDPRQNDYFTGDGSPARDAALRVADTPFCGDDPDMGFLETCS